MADISTFVGRSVWGNECMTWGTYTYSAGTGDTINTKLHMCNKIFTQPYGSSVGSDATVINETFPVAGNAIDIVALSGETGLWIAWGDSFA